MGSISGEVAAEAAVAMWKGNGGRYEAAAAAVAEDPLAGGGSSVGGVGGSVGCWTGDEFIICGCWEDSLGGVKVGEAGGGEREKGKCWVS